MRGLQDQPQALVVQPGEVSEVEVSESEADSEAESDAVSQFPGVMRLLAGDEAGDKAAARDIEVVEEEAAAD